jgi:hypothetical protein
MGQQIVFALRDSMHRVLIKLASFLPGLLALLVAVVILTAVGALLALILRRILTAVKFDERFARSQTVNVADWSPRHSPTVLVTRTVFWACVILGFIIGISALDASYAGNSQIAAILIPYFTHSVGAVLLLLAGTIIARFLSRSVLIGAVNLQMQYARLLSLGVKWLVLVLTTAMVLDHLEIGGTIVDLAFGILFGGIVLTLSLAIGLGSRDLVSRSLPEPPRTPRPKTTSPTYSPEPPHPSPNHPRPCATSRAVSP